MRLFILSLVVSLAYLTAVTPEDIPLQIVNASPVARIDAAKLTVDKAREVFSYSQVIQNTSARPIINVSLELKTTTMVNGHVVNSSVHVERVAARVAPNTTMSACIAADAPMPAFLKDVSAGTLSIIRVQFEDGTVWERPSE